MEPRHAVAGRVLRRRTFSSNVLFLDVMVTELDGAPTAGPSSGKWRRFHLSRRCEPYRPTTCTCSLGLSRSACAGETRDCPGRHDARSAHAHSACARVGSCAARGAKEAPPASHYKLFQGRAAWTAQPARGSPEMPAGHKRNKRPYRGLGASKAPPPDATSLAFRL